jgi:hypothetical protein
MKPAISLQLSATAFTVFWFGWMLWLSGTDDLTTIIILAFCCVVTGYVWYGLIHWSFRHMRLLPRHASRRRLVEILIVGSAGRADVFHGSRHRMAAPIRSSRQAIGTR